MNRTSLTHPLQIAAVRAGPGLGRIGITFCPGKKQPLAATGAWDRDLCLDVAAIAEWGAVAVLTLTEDHELATLGASELGDEVRRRHMDWLHAPIQDISVPDAAFGAAWRTIGEGLRARLRCGFDIVVHCKGGLGRAGMVAARLLVELGWDPAEAIAKVRAVRPGAIETEAQERHVLACRAQAEFQPSRSDEAIRDRAVGSLLGLAVGDALGTTLEFKVRDTYEPLTDIVGGGPFGLKAGEWTDDTAMALALAESLAECGHLDEQDLMARFVSWWRTGTYSCTGRCFDIGTTTRAALARWERTGHAHCGDTAPDTAGNGSLMRMSPVAIRYWNDRPALRDAAARQSKTTHAAPEAVDACVLYAEVLADAIAGEPRSVVLGRARDGWSGKIAEIAAGSWRGKDRARIRASGYVVHSLEAALWSVGRSADFRSSVLHAANLGEDADTTGAIAGQLAGALWGSSGIKPAWLEQLSWRGRLEAAGEAIFTA